MPDPAMSDIKEEILEFLKGDLSTGGGMQEYPTEL